MKSKGYFYCATYGENGIVEYVEKTFEKRKYIKRNFYFLKWKRSVREFFDFAQKLHYDDRLKITCIDDFIDYLDSLSDMMDLIHQDQGHIKNVLENAMQDGVLVVPKDCGIFIYM